MESILPLFGRDPLTMLGKLPLMKIRYQGGEKDLLDLKAIRYAFALVRKNICINRQKSGNDEIDTRGPETLKVGDFI